MDYKYLDVEALEVILRCVETHKCEMRRKALKSWRLQAKPLKLPSGNEACLVMVSMLDTLNILQHCLKIQ